MHRGFLFFGLAATFALPVLTSTSLMGCKGTAESTVTLDFGQETDVFTRAPATTLIRVDAVNTDGTSGTIAEARTPVTSLDLGTYSTEVVGSFRVLGYDDGNTLRSAGFTLPFSFKVLPEAPLRIFTQRTGELARMPSDLVINRAQPVIATVYSRYFFVAGGPDGDSATRAISYDFYSLTGSEAPARLPRPARSMAPLGDGLLIIDENGATFLNVQTLTTAEVSPPPGTTFADVAGGETFSDGAGTAFVVGATRHTGAPTTAILQIDVNGALTMLNLAAPRLGASAAWAIGRGLVVADGVSLTPNAPTVEIFAPRTTVSKPLPFPLRGVSGSDAVTLPDGKVALAGGVLPDGSAAPLVSLDPGCAAAACTYANVAPGLPVALSPAQAFSVTGGFLVLGERTPGTGGGTGDAGSNADAGDAGADAGDAGADAGSNTDFGAGSTLAFRVDATTGAATQVVLKVPRSNARAARSPTGTIVLVGGDSKILESFTP